MPLLVTLSLLLAVNQRPAPCREHDGALIPHGYSVLMDGHLDGTEWADACELSVSPTYRLLLKHDAAYLYLAVVRSTPAVFGVNLYLRLPDALFYLNLHASAKLGERQGRYRAWPDWVWWNNAGWSANVERFNAFTGERFLPDTVKEFQIALGRLPGPNFLLTLDVETAVATEQPVGNGPVRDGVHWMALRIGP